MAKEHVSWIVYFSPGDRKRALELLEEAKLVGMALVLPRGLTLQQIAETNGVYMYETLKGKP